MISWIMTTKAQEIKEKIDKVDFMKIFQIDVSKDNIHRVKGNLQNGRKYS